MSIETTESDLTESGARALDDSDALRGFRERFFIPPGAGGKEPSIYLVGNSLGCQPRAAGDLLKQELEDWARLGVEGHVDGRDPWLRYHEQFREPLARLVGAKPDEVVVMNTLTVNLHLLMVSFYRPTAQRYRIVIEDAAFPSDSYAVASQAAVHGFDPSDAILRLKPRDGETLLRTEDVEAVIREHGDTIALVMLGAVNYLTGQFFDMERITKAGHDCGAKVGWDLAHAVGNVPCRLHDCGADFAAWCHYKYVNSGPGAVAGAFVHERHAGEDLPRFAGWWGNDPETRFIMGPDFVPRNHVDAWQISNPPILAMTPLKASLAIYEDAGIDRLREKSIRLTGYLERLLRERCSESVSILSPTDAEQRGAQLSISVKGDARTVRDRLFERGVVLDFREPDVLRPAPAPLYVSFQDVWRFVDILQEILS